MSSKRIHLMLVCLMIVLFAAIIGGAYGINSLLSKESLKLTDYKAKNQALKQEYVSMIRAKSEIARYADLEKITRAIVPEDKSQAEAVRQIVNFAAKNGITLQSISFPASTLGNTVAKPGAAAPAAPVPAGGASGKSLSQLVPVKGMSGVYHLTITVTSDPDKPVEYPRFINFLKDLESNRRTAQVSSIIIEPSEADRKYISFTLILNNYIKP